MMERRLPISLKGADRQNDGELEDMEIFCLGPSHLSLGWFSITGSENFKEKFTRNANGQMSVGSANRIQQQCFSIASTRRPADLLSSFTTIKTVMNNLHGGLGEVLLTLLKSTDTREGVLEYVAVVIQKNSSRSHIQVDALSCASLGTFVNLSAVMLRLLCVQRTHLDLRNLTALHASSEEATAWINKDNPSDKKNDDENGILQSQEATSSGSNAGGPSVFSNARPTSSCGGKPKYSFICECFFMTARVLNLGLLKAFSDFKHLVQDLSRCEDTLSTLKAMWGQAPSSQLELDITRLEKEIESYTQEKLCYEAQILRDGALLQRALSFYRLMVVWFVDLLGGFKMPLPSSCPMEFACMPEHFIEDAMELLIFASQIPKALDGVLLDDFMNFIIMFMASPNFIRNPYLRAKMVEVLNCWMPSRSGSSVPTSLFEGHTLSLEYLVRNLLKLYVNIEFTGGGICSGLEETI
ncbi:hypothetical protein NE237_020704 [Protea cynaroides]|uniref:Ubiquitin conjugation factor E4 core domain-containing protein n=1 Tax=Protea cynaroides TaxID=273540 RepID=A0A9Q0H7R2_9MAGN|nr:hypothetical protein NE237_020704 [Protea cynaroides]